MKRMTLIAVAVLLAGAFADPAQADPAERSPELNKRVSLSLEGASPEEALGGLARANGLKLALDPRWTGW